jgi:signal transduction histidine kinase
VKKISFAGKLILAVILTCTLAIAVVGSYSFYTARRSLMTRTFDQLTSIRTVKQKQVTYYFSERLREISLIAALLSDFSHPENQTKENRIKSFLGESKDYTALLVIDEFSKSIIFRSPESSDSLNFSLPVISQRSVLQSDVFIMEYPGTDAGLFRVLVIAPLSGEDWEHRYLVGVISGDAINNLIFDAGGLQGLGSTGETFMAGPDFYMRTPSRFSPDQAPAFVKTDATVKAFAGLQGTEVIEDYRGVMVLSSFSRLNLPGLDWVICAEIDLQEATIPVYRIRNNIMIISVSVVILVVFILYFISHHLTRPVVELMRAADEIGSGRFSTRVRPTSNDEIGRLAMAFNRMSRQLQQNDEALKKEKAQRIRSVFDGQEIERQRLSRELHDGLGQSLIAIKLRLENPELEVEPRTSLIVEGIKTSFDKIIDEVRRISNNLMPAALHEFGLENALRNHCEELSEQTGISMEFASKGNAVSMSRKTKIYLYRIAQEALNNVVKHSGASKVRVQLLKEPGSVQLTIADDGKGINREESCSGRGNGLFNMRERANLLQGRMQIETAAGMGTTISIHLPLN